MNEPTPAEIQKALYPKRSKYGVAPKEERTWDGIVFASKHEMQRYLHLKMLERAGIIKNLQLQTKLELSVNGRRIGEYRPDFQYDDLDGRTTYEDAKGVATALFKWKKKHAEIQYGIRIIET